MSGKKDQGKLNRPAEAGREQHNGLQSGVTEAPVSRGELFVSFDREAWLRLFGTLSFVSDPFEVKGVRLLNGVAVAAGTLRARRHGGTP